MSGVAVAENGTPGGAGPTPAPPHPPPPPVATTGLLHLAMAASFVAFAVALMILLLFLEDRGNTIAGPVSLCVAMVTLAVTLVLWLAEKEHIRLHLATPVRFFLRCSVWVLCAAASVGAIVLLGTAFADREVSVTDEVELSGTYRNATDGSSARVAIPDPGRNDDLAISFNLVSVERGVGNCGGSAYLTVTVRLDGRPPTEVHDKVYRGMELHFSLRDATEAATVTTTLHIPRDPSCRIDLSVEEATLFSGDGE